MARFKSDENFCLSEDSSTEKFAPRPRPHTRDWCPCARSVWALVNTHTLLPQPRSHALTHTHTHTHTHSQFRSVRACVEASHASRLAQHRPDPPRQTAAADAYRMRRGPGSANRAGPHIHPPGPREGGAGTEAGGRGRGSEGRPGKVGAKRRREPGRREPGSQPEREKVREGGRGLWRQEGKEDRGSRVGTMVERLGLLGTKGTQYLRKAKGRAQIEQSSSGPEGRTGGRRQGSCGGVGWWDWA